MAERMLKLLQCIPIFLCILGGRDRFSDLLLLMFHFVSTLSREGGINIFPEKKKKRRIRYRVKSYQSPEREKEENDGDRHQNPDFS